MYKGFPVGYLLFWSNAVAGATRAIGTDIKQKNVPRLLIVDGQQRLTSLYAVLKNAPVKDDDYTDQKISIAFRPNDGTFEVTDAAIEKDPEFIPDISELWAGQTSRNRFVRGFIDKLRQHRKVMANEEEDRLIEAIDRLYDLQIYPFTALELSTTVDEEHVAEVFVRINSQGVTLKQADFILTLMSVFWDEGRAELEQFCRKSRVPSLQFDASPFNYFIEPDPDEMLRVSVVVGFRRAILKYVYSILRGKDLETGEFHEEDRIRQFKVLEESQEYVLNLKNWHQFLKILLQAGFRRQSMITSKNAFLYSYSFFLIGQRDFGVSHDILRNIIARWFFMSSLTGRYSSSPESAMESDLVRLRNVKDAKGFVNTLEQIIDDTFHQIILEEKSNSIFVNVSVGSKIQAIASMMACMMFKDVVTIKPYYVVPKDYTIMPQKRQQTEGMKEIIALPDYKIEIPSKKLVKCLELVHDYDGGKVSKKKLKDFAIQNKLIHERSREDSRDDEYSEQAGFMALNKTLIEPLRSWGFITVEKIGSHNVVSLTSEGRDALRFLKV